MRFYILSLTLLPLIISALPLPDNATSDAANVLANGIQANLNHGQVEIQTVQTLQSLESNSASAADIATGMLPFLSFQTNSTYHFLKVPKRTLTNARRNHQRQSSPQPSNHRPHLQPSPRSLLPHRPDRPGKSRGGAGEGYGYAGDAYGC